MAVVTNIELEVLNLMAKGLSNDEIGRQLFKSGRTVQMQITALNLRFDTKTRTELVVKTLAMGIINNPFAPMKSQ